VTQSSSLRISVVIPTYNRATLVQQAVRSALEQTLPPLEIICVDDASTDATGEALEALSRREPGRVRAIRHERNQGAAATQNTGVAAAQGDWVCLLGDDDLLLPHALATLAEWQSTRSSVGLLHADHLKEKDLDPSSRAVMRGDRAILDGDPTPLLFVDNFIRASGALIRRDLWQKAGGMDPQRVTAEDYDLWFRLARAGCEFLHVPEPLVVYRVWGQNVSRNRVAMHRHVLAVLETDLRTNSDIPRRIGETAVRDRLLSQRLRLALALLEGEQEEDARRELEKVWRQGRACAPVQVLRLRLWWTGLRCDAARRLIKKTALLLRDRAIVSTLAAMGIPRPS
jgi:glycosyltransferase involved in cell wall biosynthesis